MWTKANLRDEDLTKIGTHFIKFWRKWMINSKMLSWRSEERWKSEKILDISFLFCAVLWCQLDGRRFANFFPTNDWEILSDVATTWTWHFNGNYSEILWFYVGCFEAFWRRRVTEQTYVYVHDSFSSICESKNRALIHRLLLRAHIRKSRNFRSRLNVA